MSTLTGATPRPIRFTSDIPTWQRILEALGATLISDHPGWLVYQLGGGRVALHDDSADQPAGRTVFAVENPAPLAEAVDAAAARGVPVTLADSDHGPAGHIHAPDGTFMWLDQPTPGGGAATRPELSVLPIWYGPDPQLIRGVLEGLGASARLVGDNGTWSDFTWAGGGLAASHAADSPGVELSFEWDGDVEDALALLREAGAQAVLLDETYGRTVRFADPDGGAEIWINERQTDLYGYRQEGGPATGA